MVFHVKYIALLVSGYCSFLTQCCKYLWHDAHFLYPLPTFGLLSVLFKYDLRFPPPPTLFSSPVM